MKNQIIALRNRLIGLLYRFGVLKKKGVLFYLGMHKGFSFDAIFRGYRECYGFEANPKLFKILKEKYKRYPHAHIYNVAVAKENGEIEFNVSNNEGASSSIGTFHKDWNNKHVKMVKKIRIQSINLLDFINAKGISYIDSYVSDIQGFDLEVLKTLRPMIEQRKITSITCEVAKDKYGNIYKDLPDNSEKGFNLLLAKNYECVAKGWGKLKNGQFNEVPEDWWEMDCRWELKRQISG